MPTQHVGKLQVNFELLEAFLPRLGGRHMTDE